MLLARTIWLLLPSQTPPPAKVYGGWHRHGNLPGWDQGCPVSEFFDGDRAPWARHPLTTKKGIWLSPRISSAESRSGRIVNGLALPTAGLARKAAARVKPRLLFSLVQRR